MIFFWEFQIPFFAPYSISVRGEAPPGCEFGGQLNGGMEGRSPERMISIGSIFQENRNINKISFFQKIYSSFFKTAKLSSDLIFPKNDDIFKIVMIRKIPNITAPQSRNGFPCP